MKKLPDTRTPDEHMSDVAGAAWRQLNRLADELDGISRQFLLLSDHFGDREPVLAARLRAAGHAASVLTSQDSRELLRKVSGTLPVRGIDFDVQTESTTRRKKK